MSKYIKRFIRFTQNHFNFSDSVKIQQIDTSSTKNPQLTAKQVNLERRKRSRRSHSRRQAEQGDEHKASKSFCRRSSAPPIRASFCSSPHLPPPPRRSSRSHLNLVRLHRYSPSFPLSLDLQGFHNRKKVALYNETSGDSSNWNRIMGTG